MKRILLFLCFAITTSMLSAQKIYFVYLQTENNDPFFVRMDDKLYSSSPSGYLILPRLKDSTYHFRLGFPGKDIDLDFSTTVNRKDHGYLVKNFGEKGWGLFDLQSLSVQMSTSKMKGTAEVNKDGDTQVDAFTELLSKAADDPSLKQNVVLVREEEKKPVAVATIQKEEKKPEVTEAVVKEEKKPEPNTQVDGKQDEKKSDGVDKATDQKPGITSATVTDPKKSEPNVINSKSDEKNMVAIAAANEKQNDSIGKSAETVKKEDAYKKSIVTKISATETREGFESVFVDEQNGNKDTIRILIPVGNKEAAATNESKPDSTKTFLEIDPDTKQMNRSQAETKSDQPKKWWPFANIFGKKQKEAGKSQSPPKSTPSQTQAEPTTKKEEPKKWNLFGKNKDTQTTKTPSQTQTEPTTIKEEPKKWNPFAKNKDTQTTKTSSQTKTQPTTKSEQPKKWNPFASKNKSASTVGKTCEAAAHEDFLKLRRRMAEKTNDDAMLEEARKYFKEKCFTTEQIKNLSSMFLSNAGKYNFFELAHHNVTDKENFSTLQSELKDEYYVSRFKTLVGN
jgi:uncharacterized protein DUF4476